MYAKNFHVSNRICVYAQIFQCWKTLLSKIIIRNVCACTQKSSTFLLRICVYALKIQQMIIIKSSNNPIVDVLRPAQKLQVWNTYIPGYFFRHSFDHHKPKLLSGLLIMKPGVVFATISDGKSA